MSDRSKLVISFATTAAAGGSFLLGYWSSRGAPVKGLALLVDFAAIIGVVHWVGGSLYLRQRRRISQESQRSAPRAGLEIRRSSDVLRGQGLLWTPHVIRSALVQQVVILGASALVLDGGRVFRICGIAAVAYWVGLIIILGRRSGSLTLFDVAFVRLGFLVLAVVVGVSSRLV